MWIETRIKPGRSDVVPVTEILQGAAEACGGLLRAAAGPHQKNLHRLCCSFDIFLPFENV